ncbi:MAG TPA: hypothetical protein VHZ75_07020 [Solirubrobacteraceae bacterium]|jgi:hypothetical protein|nr:hypothetical protein [Solirubrobacteraceae bacterium]
MASSGKKKTTMAKLMRESRLRERRLDKQARKDARKSAAALGEQPAGEELLDALGDTEDDAELTSQDGSAPEVLEEPRRQIS